MSSTPLLVVLGATGKQGGSVLSHFLSLSSSPYVLRGITRDPSSAKSAALAERGVEMVAGDFDDPSSLDVAFKGASAIFSVTDFWIPFWDPSQRQKAASAGQSIGERCRALEAQQNRNIIDAAARVSTLKRFIYSGMANSNKLSDGKYAHNYHFEGKALAEEYGAVNHPALWEKTSVFIAGMYLENYLGEGGALMRPKLNKAQDTLFLKSGDVLGTAPFPFYSAVDDTGALVHALLQAAPIKPFIGVNEWLSIRDVVKLLAQVLGKNLELVNEDPDFDNLGDPDIAKEMTDMMGFCVEFGYDGAKAGNAVAQPADLGVPLYLKPVKEWLAKQDWASELVVDENYP